MGTLDATRPAVLNGHKTVVATNGAVVGGSHGTVLSGDEIQQDDAAYMPDEEDSRTEVVTHTGARPAPVLNGQHVKVVVDGRTGPTTQAGVPVTGVDNTHELTNAAVGHADEVSDNAAEPVPVEGKADEEPVEAKADDAQVAVGDAAVNAANAEVEDADHDGDRAPETAEDTHHFTEAKEDAADDNIKGLEAKPDDVEEETPRTVTRPATVVRRPATTVAAARANADDEMIQDN